MTWTSRKMPQLDQRTMFRDREVVEFRKRDKIVRAPALIGKRYEVNDILAAGGMGAILKAYDTKLGRRPVLVKMNLLIQDGESETHYFHSRGSVNRSIPREVKKRRQRMERECHNLVRMARILDDRVPVIHHYLEDYAAQLHGPHEDPVNWYWEDEDALSLLQDEPYLVLAYIDGESLYELLASNHGMGIEGGPIGRVGSWPRVQTALALAKELCTLLGQMHRPVMRPAESAADGGEDEDTANRALPSYYVFQDLKPQNLVRTPTGQFFLIDLGTVSNVVIDDGWHRFEGERGDTENYRAPEVEEDDVTELSDLYSLGATLYHTLTGNAPTRNLTSALDVARADLATFPEFHTQIFDFVRRCTLADRQARRDALTELAIQCERDQHDGESHAMEKAAKRPLAERLKTQINDLLGGKKK